MQFDSKIWNFSEAAPVLTSKANLLDETNKKVKLALE